MKISFNEKEVKKMSKAKFMNQHKHLARVDILEAHYQRINPKNVKGSSK